MTARGHEQAGFTLVELMTVVLVIGILVTIAIPVYTRSRLDAETKSCQANQRIIVQAIEIARASDVSFAGATEGQLAASGSTWYGLLIPDWIESKPTCPVWNDNYYLSATGEILGDSGPVQVFKLNHQAP